MLPSEPGSAHDLITPEFVQDHIILCDLASRENTAVVTLSGLRGQLVQFVPVSSRTAHVANCSRTVTPLHFVPACTGRLSFSRVSWRPLSHAPHRSMRCPLYPHIPRSRPIPRSPSRRSIPRYHSLPERPSRLFPPAQVSVVHQHRLLPDFLCHLYLSLPRDLPHHPHPQRRPR